MRARFAEANRIPYTWVTKIIRGHAEGLTYPSFLGLVAAFEKPADKDQLYEAWLETYAPSPIQQLVPELWSADEEVIAYARMVHEQISAGSVLQTFKSLGYLWNGLKEQPRRSQAALEVGSAYIEAAQQLDRIGVALGVCHDLQLIARLQGGQAWQAQSLWLQGLTLRLVRPRQLIAAEKGLIKFGQYLAAWQPLSALEGRQHQKYLLIAARDHVLSGLDLFWAKQVDVAALSSRITILEVESQNADSPEEVGLASEVIARARVASGSLDEAARALAIAGKNVSTTANQLKVRLCQIQLLVASGESDLARSRIEQALDQADQFRLVHQRQKLSIIQRQLDMLPPGRSYFSM